MWVIVFQDTPHFWLIGGESYRVGKKDCHVVIQDDRSISRTHLTITVGSNPLESLQASEGAAAATTSADKLPPQTMTLLDSSTYGSVIVAGGEETDEDTQDPCLERDAGHQGYLTTTTSAVLETGIVGLRYAPSALRRQGSHSTRRSTKASTPPTLQLPKGQPYDVPVHRAAWREFQIQLGHHGAALRLVWVEIAALCEDVELEAQTKLEHALRYCGVRQAVSTSTAAAAVAATSFPSASRLPASSKVNVPASVLGRNTLSQQSNPGMDAAPPVGAVHPPPTVLGGSGLLSLSQRTSVQGTPSLLTFAAAAAPSPSATCFNSVSFLVTSTVQPSTAVVAMLCRATPIVTPGFFLAIRDRPSPQVPLPDPRRFVPPLSPWWRDFLTQVLLPPSPQTGDAEGKADARYDTSGSGTASSPSFSVAAAAASVSEDKLADYFAPHPQRRELFAGLTFVVVQQALYEEVAGYLDGAGAQLVWDGGIADALGCMSNGEGSNGEESLSASSISAEAFAALQSFFMRHQRHVLLYNDTEAMSPQSCLPVLRHALGLCSVEYGDTIEAIVTTRPLQLSDFPANARLPQTIEEVAARVKMALGTASDLDPDRTQDSDATQDEDEATEGRRTDAQPLFPEVGGDGSGAVRRRDSVHQCNASAHKRPRREDADGWVTLEKLTHHLPMQHVSNGDNGGGETPGAAAAASMRTVDIHCSPCALPPYPCFNGAPDPSTATRRGFMKQSLPPPEPLVELEEHQARRQLAASMLTARVPTVDAENVVPEQVVMGGGLGHGADTGPGGFASGRAVETASATFNAFDTAAHNASSKRKGTAARRGRAANLGASTSAPSRSRGALSSAVSPPTSALAAAAATRTGQTEVVEVEGTVSDGAGEGGQRREATASSEFHIFDIDGIF